MALEAGNFIGDLVPSNPGPNDPKSQGDDHLRLIKEVLQNSFSGFMKSILVTGTAVQGSTVDQIVLTTAGAFGLDSSFSIVTLIAPASNSGAMEININGSGYKNILTLHGDTTPAGAVVAGQALVLLWDGNDFYLLTGGAVDTAYSRTNTPSFPDNSDAIATTAYVAQAALSSVLPGLAGNAGKYLQVDPTESGAQWNTVANWLYTITSGNYTIIDTDKGKWLDITGGTTHTLDDLASLSADFFVYVRNSTNAGLTLGTTGGDTINGDPDLLFPPNTVAVITVGGGEFKSFFFNVGSDAPVYTNYQAFTTSGTFTPTVSGLHRITLIGAGGSGGAARQVSAVSGQGRGTYATGGGGGEMGVAIRWLKQGVNYTVTCGVGGAGVSVAAIGATADGNAGGQSRFHNVTEGIDITAAGGGGGRGGAFSASLPTSLGNSGGAGGTGGTGADFYAPGGAGRGLSSSLGSVPATTSYTKMAAVGGGAPSLFSTPDVYIPTHAGDCYAGSGSTTPSGLIALSGGGGAGAPGGAAICSTGSAGSFGGGSFRPGAANVNGTPGYYTLTTSQGTSPRADWRLGYPVNGRGGFAEQGGGGNGGSTTTTGQFGGSGAVFNATSSTGGTGAGSGGAVGTTGTVASGNGGNGFVIVEW